MLFCSQTPEAKSYCEPSLRCDDRPVRSAQPDDLERAPLACFAPQDRVRELVSPTWSYRLGRAPPWRDEFQPSRESFLCRRRTAYDAARARDTHGGHHDDHAE